MAVAPDSRPPTSDSPGGWAGGWWVGFVGIVIALLAWHVAVATSPRTLVPGPIAVARAIGELVQRGLLVKYAVASLFRVTWGYCAAVAVAIPAGIALALSRWRETAFNPVIQVLRPISPLAWIPIAILWFGVGDVSAIALIFIASVFPLMVATAQAVHDIDPVHLSAGTNFALPRGAMLRSVVLPAILPQLIVAMRIALGIAWLVVVAAEMIAVNSGLGYLVIDSRNAGKRYDLVVAAMLLIGTIGLALNVLVQRVTRLRAVRWGVRAGSL